MTPEFRSKFLENRDATGRFIVTSKRTGKSYFVEAIGDPHVEWGSVNPGSDSFAHFSGGLARKGNCQDSVSICLSLGNYIYKTFN